MGWGIFEDAVNIVIIHPTEEVGKTFVSAANETAKGVTAAANWTAHATVDAANMTAHLVEQGANITAKGFNDAGSWVGGAAESAWEATSEEAEAIGSTVESAGIVIGTGFVLGAEAAAKGIEEGAELAGKGLVEMGEYVTQHLCALGVGAALSAAFAAMSADGEEEEATGAVAVACAMGGSVAMDIASVAMAKTLVEPVYLVPGVSSALGDKDNVEDLVSFIISQACEENKNTVVASAGQFLVGLLIYSLTAAICEGKVPGGFQAMKDAKDKITA